MLLNIPDDILIALDMNEEEPLLELAVALYAAKKYRSEKPGAWQVWIGIVFGKYLPKGKFPRTTILNRLKKT